MIPSAYVFMKEFPLTGSGKVNENLLPNPEIENFYTELTVPPQNVYEEKLVGIWEEILNVKGIGVKHDFFSLGGHSLLATQIISRIKDIFEVEVPLKILFEDPNISALAKAVKQAKEVSIGNNAPIIKHVDDKDFIPLSFAQQRMWFLHEMTEENSNYNIPAVYKLCGKFNLDFFKQSLNQILSRHEVFRTAIISDDGKPKLVVLKSVKFEPEIFDLTLVKNCDEVSENIIKKFIKHRFNLSTPPFIRTCVIKLRKDEYLIAINVHHIISDGWSMNIFMKELTEIYSRLSSNNFDELEQIKIQYSDFTIWQRNWLKGDVLIHHLNYWRNKLADAPPLLQLPYDHPRPAVQTANGAYKKFQIDKETSSAVKELAKNGNASVFMVFLSALYIMLYKYSNQNIISVGTPIANRKNSELEKIIGMFVNTLVLKTKIDTKLSFNDFLKKVKLTALEAYEYQDIPFELVVDAIQPERNTSYSPLFQVMLVLQNTPINKYEISNELIIQAIEQQTGNSKFDLTITLNEERNNFNGFIEYNSDLFEDETIDLLLNNYLRIAKLCIDKKDIPLNQINLLSEKENLLLDKYIKGNGAKITSININQMLEEQADLNPDRIAVAFGDQKLNYKEFNKKVNKLAHYLLKQNIHTEDVVGIYLTRSINMIVSLFAVLKAGCAYVPLDVSYPKERLEHVLRNSKSKILITEKLLFANLPNVDQAIIIIDEKDNEINNEPHISPNINVNPENLAYVIYTSGSTGEPKGVMITHKTIINLSQSLYSDVYKDLNLTNPKIVLNAPIMFDASVQQIMMILYGITLHVIPEEMRLDINQLSNYLQKYEIDGIDCVPSQLKLMIENGLLEKKYPLIILPGGEAIDKKMWKEISESVDKIFFNMYGPTECTVDSISCKINKILIDPVIGRPLNNIKAFILNKDLNRVPVNVSGEIFLGGDCLARGYFNKPELTAEKFIPDPFSDLPGKLFYKTGDLGKFRNDGNIVYQGRIDNQIKLHGFRIELEEIETSLKKNENIKDARIINKQDENGGSRLIAFYSTFNNSEIEKEVLKNHLHKSLPNYMIPQVYFHLNEFPLTGNGKVNVKELHKIDVLFKSGRIDKIMPLTEIEKKLAEIWSEILNVKDIGIEDNFFELGGDSIISIQVVARAKKFGIKIQSLQIFKYQNIKELAAVAENITENKIDQNPIVAAFPLTPIQKWFFERHFVDPNHYNQSILLRITENPDPTEIKKIIEKIMRHHDMLRARFYHQKNKIVQEIDSENPVVAFDYFDLSKYDKRKQEIEIELKCKLLQAGLDILKGIVFRGAYFHLGENNDRIFFVAHHLIIDGVSWRIILEDFMNGIRSGKEKFLPLKTTSFKKWADSLIQYSNTEKLKSEINYWAKFNDEKIPVLPTDHVSKAIQQFTTLQLTSSLTEEETFSLITEIPAKYNVTINEILLTALTRAVSAYSGKRSVFIALEGHGREEINEEADLSRTVGWFTTIFPIHLSLENSISPEESLKVIKEQVRKIPQNGFGFGILKYLNEDEDIADKLKIIPEPEICFNYLGQVDEFISSGSIFQPAYEFGGHNIGKLNNRIYLLDFTGIVSEKKFSISISYCRSLYDEETIKIICDNFISELRNFIANKNGETEPVYSAADFPLANLDNDKLKKLLEKLDK